MAGKVLLVNGAAIDDKYGSSARDVWDAIDRLVAADKKRGTTTTVVRLDDPNGPAGDDHVTTSAGDPEFKAAVDRVATTEEPDYIVLLGAPDLIPHQTLDNPTPGDADPDMPSDLPYACGASYSTDVSDFRAPTRVVSRLPDENEATDPALFIDLLDLAAGWKSRPVDDYSDHLGVSAEVWQASTALSLTNLFGSSNTLQLSPTEGPDWSTDLFATRSHFFNCHGGPFSPLYVGEGNGNKPVAHDASLVDGKLEEGTVLSAECCYGAELYPAQSGRLGMAYTYLQSGAYAVFGSTCTAYGPATGNASADLICQFFLRSILKGASIGRAGLEARLDFVTAASPLDPMELKALGQFIVLGDASVHPVEPDPAPRLAAKAVRTVASRRARLRLRGESAAETVSYCRPSSRHETPPDDVPDPLIALTEAGLTEVTFASYDVEAAPAALMSKAVLPAAEGPTTMHLAIGRREDADLPMPQFVAVVAVQQGTLVTSVRTLYSR